MSFCGNIAIIGGGSWATALASAVLQNTDRICWYMHRDESIKAFKKTGRNPDYLTNLQFDTSRISLTSDIDQAVRSADTLLFAIPSPYLQSCVDQITVRDHTRHIISATKGVPPEGHKSISQYLKSEFGLSGSNVAVISGPSHAEEVATGKCTYLTMACRDIHAAKQYSNIFECSFIRLLQSTDIVGIEYAGILKNIFAVAAGICHGIKHGDNFQAVLVSNALDEIRAVLDIVEPSQKRNILDSAYAGDMLVTAYSKFSRNYLLGNLISQGCSVEEARTKMGMVAEGYYGTAFIYEKSHSEGNILPIVDFVNDVLYRGADPSTAVAKLEKQLK